MELLAPTGGMEQLKAALRFGADAVYGGMTRYGLRAQADNFDEAALPRAVALAHAAGRKFYLTLNILPFDGDMDGLLLAARRAADAGVDAAIVADLGAALLLRDELPALPLHISTQANVLNARAALHWHEATGAKRIILSRELSLADIRRMRALLPPSLELEAFVHGAMCVAYSGRCLLSRALTERSGNRGECAQPCRWRYALMEERRPGEYLPVDEDGRGTAILSAGDLCMLPFLPELARAGVCSLKLEGRMKTAYYVATVVSAYRRALDTLAKQGEDAYRASVPALLAEVGKASHRALNTGFYFGAPKPPAGADGFTQSMEYVADVVGAAPAGGWATIALKNRFYAGDALEALTPRGVFPFVSGCLRDPDAGVELETASVAGARYVLRVPCDVEAGDILRGVNRNHQG